MKSLVTARHRSAGRVFNFELKRSGLAPSLIEKGLKFNSKFGRGDFFSYGGTRNLLKVQLN